MKKYLSLLLIFVALICGFTVNGVVNYAAAKTDVSGWEYEEGEISESENGIEIHKGAVLIPSLNPEKIILEFGGFTQLNSVVSEAILLAFTPAKTSAAYNEMPVTYGGTPTQTGLIVMLGVKNNTLKIKMGFNLKNGTDWDFSYITSDEGDVIGLKPDNPFDFEISTAENSVYISITQTLENSGTTDVVKTYTVTNASVLSGLKNYISADGKSYLSIYNMGVIGIELHGVKSKGVTDIDVEDTEEKDVTAPTLNVGELETESEVFEEIFLPQVTATDNVDESVAVSVAVIDPNGDAVMLIDNKFIPDKVGTYSVVFSATDISGNSASETRTVNITKPSGADINFSSTVSNTAELGVEFKIPAVSVVANDKAVKAESLKMYVKFPDAVYYMEMPDAYVAVNNTFNVLGFCTFYYVATDVWENEYVSQTFTVEIKDTVAPVLFVSDVFETVEVKTEITLPWCDVSDADKNVDFKLIVTLNGEDVPVTKHVLTPQKLGEYNVTYSATDSSGNYADKKFTIAVVDTTAPELSVEFPEKTSFGDTFVLPLANASDNYTENVGVLISVIAPNGDTLSVTDNKFVARKVGTYTVIYTATDSSGNSKSKTFNLTVVSVPPVLSVISTVPIDGFVGVEITLPDVSAFNALGESVAVVPFVKLGDREISVESGKFTPDTVGEYSVVFIATDSENNTASSEVFKINVIEQVVEEPDDNENPDNSENNNLDGEDNADSGNENLDDGTLGGDSIGLLSGCGANFSTTNILGFVLLSLAACAFMRKRV